MGKWLVFATLTVLTGIVAVGQAQAGHVSCGDTLTTNTTLDGNLNCATAPGLVIGADGITLDCAEFKIEGPGTDPVCCPTVNSGIELSGRTGVTVKNCRVTNFSVGFQIGGGSSFNTFTDNRASNNSAVNGSSFFLFGGSHNNTLTNNRADENVFGFYLSGVGGAPNNTLTGNRPTRTAASASSSISRLPSATPSRATRPTKTAGTDSNSRALQATTPLRTTRPTRTVSSDSGSHSGLGSRPQAITP